MADDPFPIPIEEIFPLMADGDVDMRSLSSGDTTGTFSGDEDYPADVIMAAADFFDDDIDWSSDEDGDDSDGGRGTNNNNGNRLFDVDVPLKYQDSLNVSILACGQQGFEVDTKGTVPIHQAGHMFIMSSLERPLPVTFISSMLRMLSPIFLRELTFSQISLRGTVQEYTDLSKALCLLENMEEFHMIDCCLLNDAGARPLDTILYGISCDDKTLPKLQHLQLYAVDIDREPAGSFLCPHALPRLIRSKPSLRYLNCEDLTLETRHIEELARALESHQSLEKLNLWGCAIGNQEAKAVARLLSHNSSIHHLELSCNEIGNEGCIALAEALHTNKSLKELRLVRNESIRHGGNGYQALLEMMRWNHTIEQLLLEPSEEVDSDLGFYLFVNRHRYLLEDDNVTKLELVDLLFSHREDPTFLFLFLKAKPALCE